MPPMLDRLRKSASGVLGFLLIGLLVVSFGIWGIADTFTGFGDRELARVGDQAIERDEFRARYGAQIRRLSDELGTPLTAAQAQNFNLHVQTLASMLASSAITQAAQEMGLAVSDAQIARRILNDPAFVGTSGHFDENTFRNVLNANGLTETLFVKDQRETDIRQQLLSATLANSLVPKKMTDYFYRYFLERRTARYMLITADMTEDIGEPTPSDLQDFYNSTKLRFAKAERRQAVVIALSPARFVENASNNDVSDDDVKEAYEDALDEFTTEEKRTIDQLVLVDDASIGKVRELLARQAPFAEIVQAAGQSLDNTDLGEVTRGDFVSADLAARAFALAVNEVSDVIEGPLGSVVLRVRRITPGVSRPLSAVRDSLRQRISYDRASDALIALSEKIEDERAGGESLEVIAQRFGLAITSLDIDREGRDPDGKPAPLAVEYNTLLATIFEAGIGEDLAVDERPDGTFIWTELAAIVPEQVQTLDDVRDAVIGQWQDAERTKLLEALATHLVKQGNNSGSFTRIEKDLARTAFTAEPITRQVRNDTFSQAAVQKLFVLKQGAFDWARVGFGDELIVLQLVDVLPPQKNISTEAGDDATLLITDGEENKYRADMLNQFVGALQSEYGVSISQSAFERTIRELGAY